MASDAAAVRDAELASYSSLELLAFLRSSRLRADFDAVARVVGARERSRAAQAKADLDAIYAARGKQVEEFSDSTAMIVEDTQAKHKASFSKIHGPLKKADHAAVPSHETPDYIALALATLSIPGAQQSKQPVVEMVKVSKGVPAAADGSVGKQSLKRKDNAVDNRGVSPVQISEAPQERMVATGIFHPPGFSPIPQFVSSSWICEDNRGVSPVQISEVPQERMVATGISHPPGFSPIPQFVSSSRICEEAGPSSYSSLSQAIMVSPQVSKEMALMGGSRCKTVTLKEPSPVEKTGKGQRQNQWAEEPAHLGGASMSLTTLPVQPVERFDTARVSKRGRGRGRSGPKGKEENKNVSEGSPSRGRGGRGRGGRGRGRGGRNTSANPVLGARSLNLPSALVADTSANTVLGARSLLNRPSPLVEARPRTVQNYPANLENGSESRNDGAVKMNIASGYAILGIGGLLLPRSSPLTINTVSVRGTSGMGSKVTENLGMCVENKMDSVPVMNNGAEGTSHEEGYVSTSSDDMGGGASAQDLQTINISLGKWMN